MTTVFNDSRLTTVPRPAVPELSRPLTPAELEEALRGFHGSYYVEHPPPDRVRAFWPPGPPTGSRTSGSSPARTLRFYPIVLIQQSAGSGFSASSITTGPRREKAGLSCGSDSVSHSAFRGRRWRTSAMCFQPSV